MKFTFKLLGVVGLTTVLAGTLLAAPPARGPQMGPRSGPGGRGTMNPKMMAEMTKRRVHDLKVALKLNSSQEKKVLAIFTKSSKKMASLFTNTKLKDDARMKAFQAQRAKTNAAINAILTPVQRKLYVKYRAEHRRGGPGGRGRGGPGGPGGPSRRQPN